ncbi:hypothetical protein HPB47_003097 [Ixodes persulcatus]|uniref:Uncharacterized protein n=1 Tax=Ixodes persulcatus TaxID=34615 RepID=A0AC60PKX3_IXOPE|nr:hypothetical protein HPB47_003097 [Ixodes persulcatus]
MRHWVTAMGENKPRKRTMRQSTCGTRSESIVRWCLSRVEEVSLLRLRAGAALTPSVTWTWGHTPADPGTCPKCLAPVATADAHHLLWLCSGTKTTREKILREAGLKGHPHDNYTQWVNDDKYYKSLLQFLHDAGLHSFL